MSVTRLIVEDAVLVPGELRVPAAAAHHARVARVREGDAVEVLDLRGHVAVGTLGRWDGRACVVDVAAVVEDRGEPPAPLSLALAVLHTAAFEWAVEKATELGATSVRPVVCARVQGRDHGRRVDRWQRVADAAVAQCGRSRAPVVEAPATLDEVLSGARGLRLLAEPGSAAPGTLDGVDGVTLLVGPEGGFTSDEVAAARAAGFAGLPLGPRILRAETAAAAGLAVAQQLLGWL